MAFSRQRTIAATTLTTAIAAGSFATVAAADGTLVKLWGSRAAEDAGLATDVRQQAAVVPGEIAPTPGLLTDQTKTLRPSGDESTATTAVGDRVTPPPVTRRARGPPEGAE